MTKSHLMPAGATCYLNETTTQLNGTSLYTGDYTYTYDKYSCIREAYFAHITFAYLVALTGAMCMLTRVIPRLKWTHKHFGRAYIVSMLWCTATSLLINNTGLPEAVLWSFIWCLGGMTTAWVAIVVHNYVMDKGALARVQKNLVLRGLRQGDSLEEKIKAEKGAMAQEKTFGQRIFSFKALHGSLMFMSWFNIAGRIFASNQTGDFECHTYPVFKPIDSPQFRGGDLPAGEFGFVSAVNDRADSLPWGPKLGGTAGWAALLLMGPMTVALVFGAIYSYFAARPNKRTSEDDRLILTGDVFVYDD